MHEIWHWLLWVLAIASRDAAELEHERARAAGCVNVAYAALAREAPPPAPEPVKPKPQPCRECDGSGKIFRSDGGYVRCKCGGCPDGACKKVLP